MFSTNYLKVRVLQIAQPLCIRFPVLGNSFSSMISVFFARDTTFSKREQIVTPDRTVPTNLDNTDYLVRYETSDWTDGTGSDFRNGQTRSKLIEVSQRGIRASFPTTKRMTWIRLS